MTQTMTEKKIIFYGARKAIIGNWEPEASLEYTGDWAIPKYGI